mmetsp:Transcript_15978/g.34684  ORF Transcript_15978/g.34684 Transcript_15978/m.34684 type:complete len:259 (+) Transcript_15978:1126-1902(+)
MANSRFEYVKSFELDDKLIPRCWVVIRLDGKGFTKFSEAHKFQKPNDDRALHLMNAAARSLMLEQPDIVLGYGESDEFSFVLKKSTNLYNRRSSKLTSVLVSMFTAAYVHRWSEYFPEKPLQYLPAFDARAVVYPTDTILRDYIAWRQADCHINNQYNTCFWALVHSGKTPTEAQSILKGTLTEHKNELLHSQFGLNYASLPEMYRKGSVLVRRRMLVEVKRTEEGEPVMRERSDIAVLHEDIIQDRFWEENLHVLDS